MDRNPDFDFNYLGFPGSYHFPINPAKIKGGCQSGREVVPHDSKSDLPLGGHTDINIRNDWCLDRVSK